MVRQSPSHPCTLGHGVKHLVDLAQEDAALVVVGREPLQ